FRLLYVSIINYYKHQWNVVEAVAKLRSQGAPIVLDLVGPAYPPALKLLQKSLQKYDPAGEFVRYLGAEPYDSLPGLYHGADGFIFASTCETISIIIMEAMAAGMPIACSNVPPMPEVLVDAGVYFDPENPQNIASALEKLLTDYSLRERLSNKAFDRSQQFTWKRCAHETFSFLASFKTQTLTMP
ncbi:MAG: glycosyltransferase family 1 protein, partial [Pseudomonadota bacterium]